MTGICDFFRPNGLKVILALTFLVPVYVAIMLAAGFPYPDTVVAAALAVIISYGAACVLDCCIGSRTVKIAIAAVAGVLSIILGYLFTQTVHVVCDPVHDPGRIVCDPVHTPAPATTEPSVIATVRPVTTTPVICDPVHVPAGSGEDLSPVTPGIVSGIAAGKLDECRKMCGR